MIAAIIFAVFLAIAMLTITEYQSGDMVNSELMKSEHETEEQVQLEKNADIKDLLKSLDFWNLFFIAFCFQFYGYYIIGAFKSIG